MWSSTSRQHHRRLKVEPIDGTDELSIGVGEAVARLEPGIVDPHIDVAELLQARVNEAIDAGSRPQIGHEVLTADPFGHHLELVFAASDDENTRALRGEVSRHLFTNAL